MWTRRSLESVPLGLRIFPFLCFYPFPSVGFVIRAACVGKVRAVAFPRRRTFHVPLSLNYSFCHDSFLSSQGVDRPWPLSLLQSTLDSFFPPSFLVLKTPFSSGDSFTLTNPFQQHTLPVSTPRISHSRHKSQPTQVRCNPHFLWVLVLTTTLIAASHFHNNMPSKKLMLSWWFFNVTLLAAGTVAIALSIVWRQPDVLMNMILPSMDLTGAFIRRG